MAAGVCAVVATLVAVFAFSGGARTVGLGVDHAVDRGLADLGVRLRRVHIQGASPATEAAIQAGLTLRPGQPLARLDLAALRSQVEAVGPVQSARIVRLFPDTLIIAVTERAGLAVWQSHGRAAVIDAEGRIIPGADPGRFAGLPLVVGDGASEAAPQLIPLLNARPGLKARIDAVVRVDQRRWDLRLKDGGIIALPAVGEDQALIQLDALDQQRRLLDLGLARIDLRVPEAPAIRPRGATQQVSVG